MKSKKMIASTALLLIVMLVAFCFIGCENTMNSDTPGGGVESKYKGLSDDNNQAINLKDYSKAGSLESLDFTKVKSGNKALPFLSKKEIKDMYNDTNPARLESLANRGNLATLQKTSFGEQNMFKVPSFVNPYFPGEPRKDILDLALARYNFVRRFAGLNGAEFNEKFHIEAQYAAWICAMYNRTDRSHSAAAYTRPDGVSDETWNLVDQGLSQCLYLSPHAANSVDIYMGDNGNGNLAHRKNLLNLYTTQVGFGVASANLEGKNRNDQNVVFYTKGATAFRFNWVKQPEYQEFDYDLIAWPPAGYFPVNTALFDNGTDQDRWSVSLNDAKYALQIKADAAGKKTKVSVTIAKASGGSETLDLDTLKTISYGSPTIFYLPGKAYEDGDKYTVKFENLMDKVNNQLTTLEYTVEFFDMSKVQ